MTDNPAPKPKQSLFKRIVSDFRFRTILTAVGGFAINIFFATTNGVTAIKYSSLWYGAMAIYYMFLSLLRAGVLISLVPCRKKYAHNPDKFRRVKTIIALVCGIAVLLLFTTLPIVVAMMIRQGRPNPSGKIMAIITAAYAFYKITIALVNLARAKKLDDPLVQAFKDINVVDAMVSMLLLETTMNRQFGPNADMSILYIVSGVIVCSVTIFIGVVMVVRSAKNLKGGTQAAKKEDYLDEFDSKRQESLISILVRPENDDEDDTPQTPLENDSCDTHQTPCEDDVFGSATGEQDVSITQNEDDKSNNEGNLDGGSTND